jgi:hypothetical protein
MGPQRTPLPTISLLLHDLAINMDYIENTVPRGTSIGYIALHDVFHCCVTVYCAIA